MRQEITASPETGELSSPLVFRPLSVDLYEAGVGNGILPKEIENNPHLREQAISRRKLRSLTEATFNALPTSGMNLTEEIINSRLPESLAIEYWQAMTGFLTEDPTNARVLLYLPFEVLPDMTKLNEESPLYESALQFADTYRTSWIRLLHEAESRANFVDGDIFEPGLGVAERISKAGHITPQLLKKGIIQSEDILTLLEFMQPELVRSLAEGTIVAKDRNLIDDTNWEQAKLLIEERIGDVKKEREEQTFMYDPESPHTSPERAAWLRKIKQEEEDRERASELGGSYTTDEIALRFDTPPHIVTAAIFEAGKQLSGEEIEQAQAFSARAEESLHALVEQGDIRAQNVITSGLQQWARLGVIDDAYLERFNAKLSDLSQAFSFSTEQLLEEFRDVYQVTQAIQEDPLLRETLYPTILLFGSRLKGYAANNADIDAAIFFKPGSDKAKREEILQTLHTVIPDSAKLDKFLEFWIEKEQGKLTSPQPLEDSRTFVGEDQIHFLLGGAWIGGGEEVEKLRADLLTRYMDLSRFGERKENKRQQLLGQLELDILQYRLMHKGYRRLYPLEEREESPHADLIDWESDFWDPGYRRVATKLFFSRVFLPDIS